VRGGGKRAAVGAARDFDKSAQLDAQLANGETHVLVRNRIEPGRGFLVHRPCALEVSALRVQDCDRGLDQSLVEKFHLAVGALPDFLPCFMTLEEAALVEEVNSILEEVGMRKARHRSIIARRCGDARGGGESVFRCWGVAARR